MCRTTEDEKKRAKDNLSSSSYHDGEDIAATSTTMKYAGKELLPEEIAMRKGILYGSLSIAFLVGGFGICMPFYQSRRDELQCDSLCYGSMTSARSFLSLIGSAFIGRMSDYYGRRTCLFIGCLAAIAGLFISASTYSVEGMWWGMVPGALLQQNFSVLKALFADYHSAEEAAEEISPGGFASSTASRASSVGKLGMSVGLSFMVGPLLGGTIVSGYDEAIYIAMIFSIISVIFVAMIPNPKPGADRKRKEVEGGNDYSSGLLLATSNSGALFLMFMRTCMALAYHIFYTIWTVSLKRRFDFGPTDHGQFMSFVGLSYALSQGFVARKVISFFGPSQKVRIIMSCCLALGIGRYFVYHTQSLALVYVLFGLIITALGIVNTILTADTSTLASSSDIGGLYGIFEAVESSAGIFGPILGGSLAKISPVTAPLTTVVLLYLFICVLVAFGYERYVIRGGHDSNNDVASVQTERKKVI